MDKKHDGISLIQLSSYVKPAVEEIPGRKWVLNGRDNSFFQYIIDRYNGSPTNESIINTMCELVYGKGIEINGTNEVYDELNEIFNKREQKKCIADFKIFGQYAMQLIRSKGGGVARIEHLPFDKLGMEKADKDGVINSVGFCEDWTKTYKYKVKELPVFKGKMTESLMVKLVQPYKPGKFYYSDPNYLASLQYAQMEEEIANYSISHILNGLSFGYIINFNNGAALDDAQKDKLERKIKQKLTGSSNAGKFILSFNDGKEAEVTVVPLEVNDAHSQWEFLSKEAMNKIIVGHGVFPALFGLETSSGFNSNADELDVQSKLVQDYQVSPIQQTFIDELAPILELAGLETDLTFIPLRDTYKSTEEGTQEKADVIDDTIDDEEDDVDVKMSSQNIEMLINLGEDINYDDWELVDDRRCDEITLKEHDLNTVFEFASVPKTGKSDVSKSQDTSLFKIRYRYAGEKPTEEKSREFCLKVWNAQKLFRAEDLNANYNYNEELATTGEDSYNIFNFKGGVNCKHWWQRVIFLKKGNKKISVNEARKMILALDPEDREAARWKKNDERVAQIAEAKNNYWSLNPDYAKIREKNMNN